MALAYWLGASTIAAEAFAAALGIPKILQNLLGDGAMSASFIPVYSQTIDAEDNSGAPRLAAAVFALLAATVAVLVLVLMLAARPLVRLLARGAGPDRIELMTDLLRIMAPGIGFIVLAAWCLGILNAHRDFFLSYVAPVLWNAAIVAALVIWASGTSDRNSIARAAAVGVLVGGLLQFVVQLPRVLRIAGPLRPSFEWSSELREVLRRFVPGIAGRGIVTVSAFTDLILASFLAVGAFSVLTKAQTLYLMPISVFAISIAAADLPELSREAGDRTAQSGRVTLAVDRVAFFLVFCAIIFMIAGRSIVAALFERGQFDSDDTVAVWLTLAVFSFGLLASGLSRIFQNAAFASGDVAGPAGIALARLLIAAAIGLALMFLADRFQVADGVIEQVEPLAFGPLETEVRDSEGAHRLGSVGLAAGGAIAAWMEFALLRRRITKQAGSVGARTTLLTLAPVVAIVAPVALLLARVTSGMHALIAAPIVVGIAGLVYVTLAVRAQSRTAIELVATARSLVSR